MIQYCLSISNSKGYDECMYISNKRYFKNFAKIPKYYLSVLYLGIIQV